MDLLLSMCHLYQAASPGAQRQLPSTLLMVSSEAVDTVTENAHTATMMLDIHLSSVCCSDKDSAAVPEQRKHRRHVQWSDRLHQVTSLCLYCNTVCEAGCTVQLTQLLPAVCFRLYNNLSFSLQENHA